MFWLSKQKSRQCETDGPKDLRAALYAMCHLIDWCNFKRPSQRGVPLPPCHGKLHMVIKPPLPTAHRDRVNVRKSIMFYSPSFHLSSEIIPWLSTVFHSKDSHVSQKASLRHYGHPLYFRQFRKQSNLRRGQGHVNAMSLTFYF